MACEKCGVWQHSACLGISQADAEKDNFHFICHICKRRAEDAKKPKIPTLKFHLGSSSSPPSQKSKNTTTHANESKKRKSNDEISNMPPMKKFKLPSASPAVSHLHANLDSMHKAMMNGPTLAPHGQLPLPTYQNGQTIQVSPVPPGLRSPSRPAVHLNGYINHDKQQIENSHQPTSQAPGLPPSVSSGISRPDEQQPATSSSPPFPPQNGVDPSQRPQSSPTSSSPFLNSFDRQRPTSAHSVYISSPTKTNVFLPPPHEDSGAIFPQTPTAQGTPPTGFHPGLISPGLILPSSSNHPLSYQPCTPLHLALSLPHPYTRTPPHRLASPPRNTARRSGRINQATIPPFRPSYPQCEPFPPARRSGTRHHHRRRRR